MQEPILIISDIHLSPAFNKKRLEILKDSFRKANTIILNGDFFDSYWPYQKVVQSKWRPLFEILKEKYVIYLFGNHDFDSRELRSAASFFVDEFRKDYVFSYAGREFVVFHGDKIISNPGDIRSKVFHNFFLILYKKIFMFFWHFIYPVARFYMFLAHRFPKMIGFFYFKKIQRENFLMKEYAKQNLRDNQILVCGHTHLSEIDLKNKFINSGVNCHNKTEYVFFSQGVVSLVSEKN